MPTYEFACQNTECKNEWEDFRSIVAPLPECPKCNSKEVIHLVSGGSGKGRVELSGRDLVDKAKADQKDFKRQVYSDEKTYANVLGEGKYQQLQTQLDRGKRNR